MPEHGQKYWHYFARMVNHPKGWPLLYRVTALNMTRIWIEWAGRLAFGCTANYPFQGYVSFRHPVRDNAKDVLYR